MQWTLNPVTTFLGLVVVVIVLMITSNPSKVNQAGTGILSRYGLVLVVCVVLLVLSLNPAVTHVTSTINLLPTVTPAHAAPIHHHH